MNSKERVDVSRELMERGVRYTGVYNTYGLIGYEKAYLIILNMVLSVSMILKMPLLITRR
ncbi:MAG: hypothetical protein ACLUDU_11475 [Butyricimonas faecihominis]